MHQCNVLFVCLIKYPTQILVLTNWLQVQIMLHANSLYGLKLWTELNISCETCLGAGEFLIQLRLFTFGHHCVKMLSPSLDSYKPCHSYIRRLFWSDGCILLTSLSEWDKIFRGSEVNEMYLTDQEHQRCLVFKRWRNYDKKTLTDNPFLISWANERPGLI